MRDASELDREARSGSLPSKVRRRGKAASPSPKLLERLLKGARAGGFEPSEIVVEATGDVRLKIGTDLVPAPATRQPNDFDSEFG